MGAAAEQGRAVTPQDLRARRALYEQCAFLSSGAALLAVLVDRIGQRERITVRPGELIAELRKRLDARDAREPLTPRLVGGWLRGLGFSARIRGNRGLAYEVRWDQLWELDPREMNVASALDPGNLNGPQLLRLLAQEGSLFFAPHIWCLRCRRVTAIVWEHRTEKLAESFSCLACRGPATVLSKEWLARAFERIRRAIRKDPDLLPRIKTEWEEIRDDAPFPSLPEPFGWFNLAWEKAGKPAGRPSSVLGRYELAHVVGQLESAGLSAEEIEAILLERDGAKRLEVYDNLSDRVHRFLGTGFRDSIGTVSVVSRPDQLWLRVRWARRQWTNPPVRVNGERVNVSTTNARPTRERGPSPTRKRSFSRFTFVREIGISGKYRHL